MFLCMIGRKGMNFDLTWLQSDLGDIAAVRQAVEKEIHVSPTPHFCCLSAVRGDVHVPAPASRKRQQQSRSAQVTSSCVVR